MRIMTARSHFLITLLLTTTTTIHAAKLYDSYSFNALTHLSDASPYFSSFNPPKDPDAPPGCKITRAAYLIRNGAIYTDARTESAYIGPFVAKLQASRGVDWCNVNGTEFAFLASWMRSPPFNASEEEVLARAGKLEASQLGVQIAYRYPDLRLPGKVWAASSERSFKTAESLVRGLELGDGEVQVVSVPESDVVPQPDAVSEGVNGTLTPSQVCGAYVENGGAAKAEQYVELYTAPILARFKTLIPGFNWTKEDVLAMQELCGYETVVKASSQFCSSSLFSSDEWLAFEYAKDLEWFFNNGYGNVEVSGTMGMTWVEAMMNLLMTSTSTSKKSTGKNIQSQVNMPMQDESPPAQPQEQDLYISVSHADLIASVITTLGLFNNSAYTGASDQTASMPLDRISYQRSWMTSNMVPFLGNLYIEKMNCSSAYGLDETIEANEGDFYRILVNEVPQVLPSCTDGPAESCSRNGLMTLLSEWKTRFGNWDKVCGGNATDLMGFFTMTGNGTLVG